MPGRQQYRRHGKNESDFHPHAAFFRLGITIEQVVPSCSWERMENSAPSFSVNVFTRNNPRPPCDCSDARKNGRQINFCCSLPIPIPLSRISISIPFLFDLALISICLTS